MQTFSFSFSSWKMLQADHEKTWSQHMAKSHKRLIPVSKRHWVLPSEEGAGDLP